MMAALGAALPELPVSERIENAVLYQLSPCDSSLLGAKLLSADLVHSRCLTRCPVLPGLPGLPGLLRPQSRFDELAAAPRRAGRARAGRAVCSPASCLLEPALPQADARRDASKAAPAALFFAPAGTRVVAVGTEAFAFAPVTALVLEA